MSLCLESTIPLVYLIQRGVVRSQARCLRDIVKKCRKDRSRYMVTFPNTIALSLFNICKSGIFEDYL